MEMLALTVHSSGLPHASEDALESTASGKKLAGPGPAAPTPTHTANEIMYPSAISAAAHHGSLSTK